MRHVSVFAGSVCLLMIGASLGGCATGSANRPPRDAELLASIKQDQTQSRAAAAAYSVCTQRYDESMIKSSAADADIADGAAASCRAQLSRWALYKNQERAHVALLNRGASSAEQADREAREAPSEEQIAADLVTRTRAAQIDYIQKLRAASASGNH